LDFDDKTVPMAELVTIFKHMNGSENANTRNNGHWSEVDFMIPDCEVMTAKDRKLKKMKERIKKQH
jgi:hypothetical protein